MEQQKNPLRNEPGRRYASGRVVPRAGSDVYGGMPTQPKVAPIPAAAPRTEQVVGTPKHLDMVRHADRAKKKRKVSSAKPALPRPNRSLVLRRHIVERADEHRKEVRRVRKRHFARFIGAAVVIAAFAVVSWSFWDFLPVLRSISLPIFNSINRKTSPEAVINKPASTLDEAKPTQADIQSYQAAPDAPQVLTIEKLNIQARVRPFGVSLTGEPIAPANIHNIGWFDDSDKPGEQGAVLLSGHMSGPTQPGVFHDLASLQAGDQIMLERGDGVVFKYVVVKVSAYSNGRLDMNAATQSISSDKPGLNLMTTASSYDGLSSRAEQRYVVFAVQQ